MEAVAKQSKAEEKGLTETGCPLWVIAPLSGSSHPAAWDMFCAEDRTTHRGNGADLFGLAQIRDDDEGTGWRVRNDNELAELRSQKLLPGNDPFGLSQMQEEEWEGTAWEAQAVRDAARTRKAQTINQQVSQEVGRRVSAGRLINAEHAAPGTEPPPHPRKSVLEKINDAMAKTIEGATALAWHSSSSEADKAEQKANAAADEVAAIVAALPETGNASARVEIALRSRRSHSVTAPLSPPPPGGRRLQGGFHGGFPPPPPHGRSFESSQKASPEVVDSGLIEEKEEIEAAAVAVAAEKAKQDADAAAAAAAATNATKRRLEALAAKLKAEQAQEEAHHKATAAVEAKRKSDESEAARAAAAAAATAAAAAAAVPAPVQANNADDKPAPSVDDDLSYDYYSDEDDAVKADAVKPAVAGAEVVVVSELPQRPSFLQSNWARDSFSSQVVSTGMTEFGDGGGDGKLARTASTPTKVRGLSLFRKRSSIEPPRQPEEVESVSDDENEVAAPGPSSPAVQATSAALAKQGGAEGSECDSEYDYYDEDDAANADAEKPADAGAEVVVVSEPPATAKQGGAEGSECDSEYDYYDEEAFQLSAPSMVRSTLNQAAVDRMEAETRV